jgi:phosphoribosyl 1,2-cyclic phosphodiesterase
MEVKIFGPRGSLPSPGPAMNRYGGNTSCVHVTLADGTTVVLDAGTGIRNVPVGDAASPPRVHILLTHLHLDHIQGLLFFSPLFRPDAEVTIWGPSAPGVPLRNRIARYLSAPLTPIEVRELPCRLDFRNCPISEWSIGSARIRAEAVIHRGPTLGYRIDDGGASLCYVPDHEPAMLGNIDEVEASWLSGHSLASGVDLLIHDCQYTDAEYPSHYGWGHSALSHTLVFAKRTDARGLLLFHHDPYHTDEQLDSILEAARGRWQALGRPRESLAMAVEGAEISIGSHTSPAAARM